MFLSLYHALRALKVPVSLTEWLTLLDGLAKGLHNQSLDDFYYLSRSLLIKDVAYYDAFDQAFNHCFQNRTLPENPAGRERILDWLQSPLARLGLSAEEIARLQTLTLSELLRELGERLREQEGMREGEPAWVGAAGESPFGIDGDDPSGIAFAAESGGERAAQQASARRYRNLRSDLTLGVRQIGVALKRLRDLRDCGAEEVLDLSATIDKTCVNAGEIDLVFSRQRENNLRLVLAMDSGGSMDPFRNISERLFSAANKLNYFKDFRAFYFHNCIYDKLYSNLETDESLPTPEVLREYGKRYRLILVGDAAMASYELLYRGATPESAVSGIDWLSQVAEAFPRRAWLNPLPESSWDSYETVRMVRGLFPMFPLTLEGLTRAVRRLL